MTRLAKAFDPILAPFGLKAVPRKSRPLVTLHGCAGGTDEDARIQRLHNERTLERVFADEATLAAIARALPPPRGAPLSGICHGARNGLEVTWFREQLGADVIGTDIAETATRFPHMTVWDFHEPNPAWEGRFDFVYTNALDQAFDPERAVRTWTGQMKPGGRLFVEHTTAHGPAFASEMDPFGAEAMVMPYLLLEWTRGRAAVVDIIRPGHLKKDDEIWVFVLQRLDPGPGAAD